MAGFQWGAGGQALTPQEVERRRMMAMQAQRTAQARPINNVWDGLASLVDSYGGYRANVTATDGEAEGMAQAQSIIDILLGGGGGSTSLSTMGGQSATAPVVADGSLAFAGQPASAPVGGNAERIRLGLIERGLPEHVADGFLLNFQDESGLNPGINEAAPTVPGSRGGFGLAQWTGPRRVALEQQAAARGVDPSDLELQLDYLMGELQGPESRAAQSILGAQDTGSAAAAIARDFLRPAEEHLNRRVANYTGGNTNLSTMGGGMSSGPDIAAILAASSNPWVQQQYGGVINALMGQAQAQQQFAMQQNDPLRQLQIQQAQVDLQRSLQPAAQEYDFITLPDGTVARTTSQGNFEPIGNFAQAEAGWTTLAPQAVQQMGLDPAQVYQQGPDGQIKPVSGNGVTVNNNMGGDKFGEEFAKLDAASLGAISEQGNTAQGNLGRIDRLESLLQEAPQGFEAVIKSQLGNYGIPTEGLNKIQAAEALINQMVPQQRPAGSGTMSDADLALFKNSLPRLVNTPEGNRLIIQAMRGIAQYDAQRGAIVQQLRNGDLDRAQAFQKIQSIPNPLSGFEQMVGQVGEQPAAPSQPEAPAGAAPDTRGNMAPRAPIAPGTVEDGYRFKGGDPSNPQNWERM